MFYLCEKLNAEENWPDTKLAYCQVMIRTSLRSEHERHAIQCPYIRGEFTDNVSRGETEFSCPAYHCVSSDEGEGEGREDRIVCLGTSMGTPLLAVGTEQGHVVLLDMDAGMLLMVRGPAKFLLAE